MNKKKISTKDVNVKKTKMTKKVDKKKVTTETTKVEEKEITIDAIETLIKSEEETKNLDKERKEELKKRNNAFLNNNNRKLKFIEKAKIADKLGITESIKIMTINRKVANNLGDFSFDISYSHSEVKFNDGTIKNEGHILIETRGTNSFYNYLAYGGWWRYNAENEIVKVFCDLLKETDGLICKRLDEIISEEWNRRNACKNDLANKQY